MKIMKSHRTCFALVLAAATLFGAPIEAAPGLDGRLIETRESPYNSIYVYERDKLIYMSFGLNRRYFSESAYDPRDQRVLPFFYTRYMTAVLSYVPSANHLLEIGFGGGRTAWYLHRHMPQTKITSVELDPEVVVLAKKHFGIRDEPNFEVVNKDGRLYLKGNTQRYDAILVDAYRGTFVPFHLLTREFYALVKEHLAPGGAVAQNIEPSTMLFDAAIATLKSVFANVDLYEAGGNIVAIAYDGPQKTQAELRARAEERQGAIGFYYPLPKFLPERRVVKKNVGAKPLTDDFAPVEMLKAVERHNAKVDDMTDRPE